MENPINTKDPIIEQITIQLESMKYSWNFAGLINFNNTIYPFGNDSKIIGRIFEIAAREALSMAAQKLGYIFQENPTQTVYPDFYFAIPNTDKLIAIDIKTTYRQSSSASFKFTAGSFTSYLRNGTKNIVGHYDNYIKHYIIGFVYDREESPTTQCTHYEDRDSIIPAYKNVEFFVQEKYKIAGEQKGSGNTDNIGTISANSIEPFRLGYGPFSVLGEEIFEDYRRHYPKYTDTKKLYTNLPTYIEWKKQIGDPHATRIEYLYNTWRNNITLY